MLTLASASVTISCFSFLYVDEAVLRQQQHKLADSVGSEVSAPCLGLAGAARCHSLSRLSPNIYTSRHKWLVGIVAGSASANRCCLGITRCGSLRCRISKDDEHYGIVETFSGLVKEAVC